VIQLGSGIYVVKRAAALSKSVEHSAIADVGNRLGLLPRRDVFHPHAVVLVHQTPPTLAFESLPDGLGDEWTVVGQITDEAGARERFARAAANRAYALFNNNCEQFASEVATGKRQSPQLFAAAAVVALGVLIWILGSSEN